ncbi:MAG: cell wall-binding repeat-containing protein [Acidimicrobiales bacterium]
MYGTDRYQSAGISNGKAFPNGVSEVVLADGLPGHQGDALAASGYAGVNGYGVLLTDNTNTVPANTMTALKNLGVKTIQPVGGTAAISSAQLAAAGYTVKPSLGRGGRHRKYGAVRRSRS